MGVAEKVAAIGYETRLSLAAPCTAPKRLCLLDRDCVKRREPMGVGRAPSRRVRGENAVADAVAANPRHAFLLLRRGGLQWLRDTVTSGNPAVREG